MLNLREVENQTKDLRTGLSPHYPFLYNVIWGMDAKEVFEFGCGGSSIVICEAPKHTGGFLTGCYTGGAFDKIEEQMREYAGIYLISNQDSHTKLTNIEALPIFFDVVLHDGSHTYSIVKEDLERIVKRMRQFSILLVHDTEHEHCGNDMRNAIIDGLKDVEYSMTTLPYGFGLSIIRIEGNEHNGQVPHGKNKASKFCHIMRKINYDSIVLPTNL
jgi:hypothetical protein